RGKVDTEWCVWGTRMTGAIRNGCRSFTGWNLALDENGKPNIGPFNCRGLVTIDSTTHAITRSGQYYAFAHLSPFVHREAVCIGSQGEGDVLHLAFRNPDGQFVLLLTNPGRAHVVQVNCDQGQLKVHLPADSLTTLRWYED
ncbi:MAG TPA: glycoside hydrolase family 30 beta sandwich domain-containing protein, partial [Armatimonadota bacterium]|nr:glycoside hydrolase family 30 beta sandwich domain-containing protein [Armatimonadota bacterium]